MEYIELGKITKIKTGKLDANASSESGRYPFFTCSKNPLKIDTYSYDCECVLVAGNGDLNVKYYNGKFDAYQRTYIIEILDKNKFDTRYIFLLLKSYLNELRRKSIGGVIKYIKLDDLITIKVPNIDLENQGKIVSNLFKIDNMINQKNTQINMLDLLIKSQFVEMFGNMKNSIYKKKILSEVTLKITDGKHGGCKDDPNSGYYFIGATEVFNNKINYANAKQITKKDFDIDYKRCDLKLDDFVIVNTGATIGKNAIVSDERCTKTLLQKSVALIRADSSKILPIYIKYLYENEPSLYNQGQGCARVNLLLSQIKNTSVPVPPIELQNKFAQIVEQIDKQKFEFEKSLKKLEEMQAALMQEYFG